MEVWIAVTESIYVLQGSLAVKGDRYTPLFDIVSNGLIRNFI